MKLIKVQFIATKEQLEELSNVLINRIQQMNVVESEYKQFIKSEFNIQKKFLRYLNSTLCKAMDNNK